MKKSEKDASQVVAGTTNEAQAAEKKKKFKIYGLVIVALVFGALGAYALLYSKAARSACTPGDTYYYSHPLECMINTPTLSPGQIVTVGGSLDTANGAYRLIMQGDGNLVVYNAARQAVWNSGTAGTGSNNRFVLQNDGNAVVYNAANQAVWNSGTGGRDLSALTDRLVLQQTDGNLVLYTALNKPLWSTFTGKIGTPAPAPPAPIIANVFSPMVAGQTLKAGQSLVSTFNGPNKLVMQGDGNLVVYNAARKAIWNSGTAGTGTDNRLVVQTDGNVVVYTSANRAVWNSGTAGNSLTALTNRLVMQDDGNVVLYDVFSKPIWSTFTGRLR